MAVSKEVRESEQATRIALLEGIKKEIGAGTYNLIDLAKAYNFVTQTDAPKEPSRAYVG
jgi:hypothetical protein